jgi:ATP-binding cassette subfamily B protein
VRDNLRYGLQHDVEDASLWEALDRAQLRRVVERLPGGLDYAISEDGSGLSAGQKQRLCLARALLTKPLVLVLDEVSANLDVETERALAESLRDVRGTSTTIVVSHRKEFIKYADETLDLTPTLAGHDDEPFIRSASGHGLISTDRN